jgi:hypothetical protein
MLQSLKPAISPRKESGLNIHIFITPTLNHVQYANLPFLSLKTSLPKLGHVSEDTMFVGKLLVSCVHTIKINVSAPLPLVTLVISQSWDMLFEENMFVDRPNSTHDP